jgi:hypothetical protein
MRRARGPQELAAGPCGASPSVLGWECHDDNVRSIRPLCMHVLFLADAQVPVAVTEPLAQVHRPVDGVNCHKSLSVPSAPVESMP